MARHSPATPARQTPAGDPRRHHLSTVFEATDIAHNCGLQQVNRLERGVAYYIEAGTLTNEQWQQVTAELHDRMMETVFLL